VEARLALATIRETGERYGAAHIIDVLRGLSNEKVVAAGHARLSTFGKGTAHKKEEWQSLLRQLVAAGFLNLDVAGYGGLGLSGKGRALLLKGEGSFSYRPPAPRADTRKARREAVAATLTTDDTSMLAALKELRMSLARQRHVPAYVIFSDRTLIDMAQRRPQNETEFAEVNGVGAAKLKEFGAIFLRAIREAV